MSRIRHSHGITVKSPRPVSSAIAVSLTVLLAAVAILILLKFRAPSASPFAPHITSDTLPSTPSATPLASELRGRRGIIKKITGNNIEIATTDNYAQPGERVVAVVTPLTSFVLITIPRQSASDRETVIRTPSRFNALAPDDDVFVISFLDITASSTFSAFRIEKIVTP